MAVVLVHNIRDVPLEEVAAQLAVLEMNNVGINKIVTQLTEMFGYNFTRTQVERLKTKETYIKTVEEYKRNIVKGAVNQLKVGTSSLVPKIIKALEVALDEGNVNAIPHALKILGIENQETGNQKPTFNVTLVDTKSPKEIVDIEVNKDDKKD